MAKHEPEAMDHSVNTAKLHYDRSKESNCVKAKKFLSTVNGHKKLPVAPSTQTTDIQERRQAREEQGRQHAAEMAAAYVEASKGAGRRAKNACQVIYSSGDNVFVTVSMLQSKVKVDEFVDIVASLRSAPDTLTGTIFFPPRKIPNIQWFPKAFYRLLDSDDLDDETKEKLRRVEEGLCVRHVLDPGHMPRRPMALDHKNADKIVGETIWNRLEEEYRKNPLWKDPATAPLLVRRGWSKKRKANEEEEEEEED